MSQNVSLISRLYYKKAYIYARPYKPVYAYASACNCICKYGSVPAFFGLSFLMSNVYVWAFNVCGFSILCGLKTIVSQVEKKVWYFLLSMSKPKGKPFLCYSLCLSGPEWSTIVNPSQQLWHFVHTFQGNPVKQPNLHIFQKPVEHALREDQLSFMGNVLYGLSICTVLLHCNVSVLLRSWIMHPKIVS